jgi:DNA-directed RNA polymerase subunit M/transcription elongation factor TFIIS
MNNKYQGQCPKCGEENLEYGELQLNTNDEQTALFPFVCLSCGTKGQEVYDMEWRESNVCA